MSIARILEEAFPGQRGTALLTQLGLLALILACEDDPDPPTAVRLAALTGLGQGAMRAHLETLLALGLLDRTPIRPMPSRGLALRISVRKTGAAGRLVEAIRRGD